MIKLTQSAAREEPWYVPVKYWRHPGRGPPHSRETILRWVPVIPPWELLKMTMLRSQWFQDQPSVSSHYRRIQPSRIRVMPWMIDSMLRCWAFSAQELCTKPSLSKSKPQIVGQIFQGTLSKPQNALQHLSKDQLCRHLHSTRGYFRSSEECANLSAWIWRKWTSSVFGMASIRQDKKGWSTRILFATNQDRLLRGSE